jgi:hypothetical protein
LSYLECWKHEPNERPNMQEVVSTLYNFLSVDSFQEDNVTKWIKNALKTDVVKFIPSDELRKLQKVYQGGFRSIMRATWTKINCYVVCKKLTNTAVIKNDVLDTFIRELQIHLKFNYSERIIHCLGISQGKLLIILF